jgi:hypothetical protein
VKYSTGLTPAGEDTEKVHRVPLAGGTDVCVDLSRLERLVAEERLDDAEVGAAVEEFGRKGVAEEMRVEPDAEAPAGAGYGIDDRPLADPPPRGHKERIVIGQRASRSEIGLQGLYDDGMKRDDAILVPLAPNP